jgi:RNA polymerase sigma-70 factor, ECF subfamily
MLHDQTEAEELVQTVFVKLWESADTIEISHSLKAYLYRMVYTRTLNHMRDKKRKAVTEPLDAHLHLSEPTLDRIDQEQLQNRLRSALDKLPTECRRIFELSRYEELKYREIADQLQISIKTVEAQMGKALKLLRLDLADYLVLLLIIGFHQVSLIHPITQLFESQI